MIGTTLGNFEIRTLIGRGGMGEVYQAKDLKLGRDVAIKVLPEEFAKDLDRVARFQREAKLLASLNHSNIAAIYGLEESGGTNFLVLELVEGETLADRLRSGPIPVEESLKLALQIAEALEAAHEKGVIHRDLKPANIKVTPEDKVKVLDFGLAKAFAGEQAEMNLSASPTLSHLATRQGIILGTAAYMSPEQARGKAVDKRTDIWAFGCILYECLTGKRAFEGETLTETLASVLKNEPDWQALPATTPPNIRFVLRRCIEKEPIRRIRDAADARILIEEASQAGAATATAKRPWLAWIAAGLFLLVAIALAFIQFRERPLAPAKLMRFQIPVPDKLNMSAFNSFKISPNGSYLVFSGVTSDGVNRLYVRALDSLEARSLPETEFNGLGSIFWSPDSRFVAFNAGGQLKKIDILGGPPQVLCDMPGATSGGSWNADDVIIVGDVAGGGLMRVSAKSGASSPLTKPNPARQEQGHNRPYFLADGRRFVYWSASAKSENTGLYLGSLDFKFEEQGSRQLLATNIAPVYIPSQNSGSGQLLFLNGQTLMAQQFDEKQVGLVGEPRFLAEQVGSIYEYGHFTASTNGVLVYRSGPKNQLLRPTWLDRQGKILGTVGEASLYFRLALSPDGTQTAVSRKLPNLPYDVWLLDSLRGTDTRFTFGKGDSSRPIWSPDGKLIIFNSDRDGKLDLYRKPASGTKEEELLLKSDRHKYPTSWSSDGHLVLYTTIDQKTKSDLCVLPLERERKEYPLLHMEFNEMDGHFSPDMRWIAYVSDESGISEVYVMGFSRAARDSSFTAEGKWLVSKGGGTGPRWGREGKELYYRASDGTVMAVEVIADKVFRLGTPKPLFPAPLDVTMQGTSAAFPAWDVTPDGNRFLLPMPVAKSSPSQLTVILNWTSLLKK